MRGGESIQIRLPRFGEPHGFGTRRIKRLEGFGETSKTAGGTNRFGGFGALAAAGYAYQQFGFPLFVDCGRAGALGFLQSTQEYLLHDGQMLDALEYRPTPGRRTSAGVIFRQVLYGGVQFIVGLMEESQQFGYGFACLFRRHVPKSTSVEPGGVDLDHVAVGIHDVKLRITGNGVWVETNLHEFIGGILTVSENAQEFEDLAVALYARSEVDVAVVNGLSFAIGRIGVDDQVKLLHSRQPEPRTRKGERGPGNLFQANDVAIEGHRPIEIFNR